MRTCSKKIPSTETISGYLELSKIWDFPGLAFKWLFLNQGKRLATLGMSVAHEYGVVSSA